MGVREFQSSVVILLFSRPFWIFLDFQNSKGKYESRKILGFAGKKWKILICF